MNKFFSMDSPFFQLMEKIADFFIVNFLTVLLFIPVITGGAALTAAHKVMQNFVMKNEQPILKSYFKAFTSNFKHATILWLITLVVIFLLASNIFLVYINFSGNLAFFLYILLGIVGVVLLGTAAFAFPMIARYENTFKQHLRNAMLLSIGNLPTTLIMVALYVIPVVLAIVSAEVFLNTSIIWIFIGISILIYFEAKLICPIFRKLEETVEEDEGEETEETN